jgi:hypothetical protein
MADPQGGCGQNTHFVRPRRCVRLGTFVSSCAEASRTVLAPYCFGAGHRIHLNDLRSVATGDRRRVEPELYDFAENVLGNGGKSWCQAPIANFACTYAHDAARRKYHERVHMGLRPFGDHLRVSLAEEGVAKRGSPKNGRKTARRLKVNPTALSLQVIIGVKEFAAWYRAQRENWLTLLLGQKQITSFSDKTPGTS